MRTAPAPSSSPTRRCPRRRGHFGKGNPTDLFIRGHSDQFFITGADVSAQPRTSSTTRLDKGPKILWTWRRRLCGLTSRVFGVCRGREAAWVHDRGTNEWFTRTNRRITRDGSTGRAPVPCGSSCCICRQHSPRIPRPGLDSQCGIGKARQRCHNDNSPSAGRFRPGITSSPTRRSGSHRGQRSLTPRQ
jgi:hypothetical protein